MTKKKKSTEPLRGEAAWLAAKADMAKRNNDARKNAAEQGAVLDAKSAQRRREIAKLEMSNLPNPRGR